MGAQRVAQQPAYVLHSRAFRETSLIVDVLSLDYGRISLLLRGVRKNNARQGAIVQLFCPLRISWSGRSELRTINQLEAAGNPLCLKGERLYSGFYVNELLVRLLAKEDPQVHLFAYYQVLLDALQQSIESTELPLRRFERQLLSQLGYDIDFTQVQGSDTAIHATVSYDYVPLNGFVPATGSTVTGALRIPGQVLLALAIDDYQTDNVRRYAKAISRAALSQLLGTRPLKSRELFQIAATTPVPAAQSIIEGSITHG